MLIDTFIILPHGTEKLERFLGHLRDIHKNIKLTMVMVTDRHLLFLDIDITGDRNAPLAIGSTENRPTQSSP
jgi:hypothetical protein